MSIISKHLLVVVVFFILVGTLSAQWEQIGTFNSQINCIYFLDKQGQPETGFVGTANGSVWWTSNHGITWQRAATPATLSGPVSNFTFKDQNIGWLSVRFATTGNAIYKTLDGGRNWFALSHAGDQTSIDYNPTSGALVTTSWTPGGNAVSLNEGANWTALGGISSRQNGIAYLSANAGIMSTFTGTFNTTGNGGLTWGSHFYNVEAWQPLAIPGENTYYLAAEGDRQIIRTTDGGATWNAIYSFPPTEELTGDIRGTSSMLFVQARSSVYHSSDAGFTWNKYCGPGNAFDTRFYVVGDTVYAGTIDGTVWWNPYGPNRNQELLNFPSTEYDFASPGCFNIDSVIRFINVSTCLPVEITGIGLLGSPTFSIRTPPQLPFEVQPFDSLRVRYVPNDFILDSAQLIIEYRIAGKTYEKRIVLRGRGLPGENIQKLPAELDLTQTSDCIDLDTVLTIKNGPCDSLKIVSLSVSDTVHFVITNTPIVPDTLGPNEQLTIRLSVRSTTPGDYSAILTITVASGSGQHPITIPLRLKVLASTELEARLSAARVRFDSVSICDTKIDSVRMTNPLCKDMFLTAINITPPDPTFTILSQPVLPNTLSPNESVVIIFSYSPQTTTALATSLQLSFEFDPTHQRDTIIPITGVGRAEIDADLSSLSMAFDPILVCDKTSLTNHIRNHSCDSLTILDIILPTDNSFKILEPMVGNKIAPNDSLLIRIEEVPTTDGAKFDFVQFRLRSASGAEEILTIRLLGTVEPKVRIFAIPDSITIDSIAGCAVFDTVITIVNLGICDTIIITDVNLAAPGWYSITGLPILPLRLEPQDSATIAVQLQPGSNASASGMLHLVGDDIDTNIVINVSSRKSGEPIILAVEDSLFTAFLCATASRSITIRNSGCDTTAITELDVSGSSFQFTFSPTPALPILVPPDSSQTVSIVFDPSQLGDSTATLSIRTADNSYMRTIQLRGTLVGYKQTARLEVVFDNNSKTSLAAAGQLVTAKVLLRDNIDALRGLTNIGFDLNFFDNVLTVTTPTFPGGWSPSTSHSTGKLHVELNRTAPSQLLADNELATVTFFVTVGDSNYSTISIENLRFNSGDSIYNTCVLEPLSLDPVVLMVDDTCGDAFIRGFINNDTKIFDNLKIVPNPTKDGSTSIRFDLARKSNVILSIVNAAGSTIRSDMYHELSKGNHTFTIPATKTAEGYYFVTIVTEGDAAAAKVIVRK